MIRVLSDYASLSKAAAQQILLTGLSAVTKRGRFDLVLSGGHTPRLVYEAMGGRGRPDRRFWRRTHVWWADERCVPADHADSNYHLVRTALLDRVEIPRENVHPICADEADPDAAAARYEKTFPVSPDLVVLGMGADGHTASLFPGSTVLDEMERRFAVSPAPVEPKRRITMTPRAIASARNVLVLVSGSEKARALRRVFAEEGDIHRTPARLVRDATWFVDEDAARELD